MRIFRIFFLLYLLAFATGFSQTQSLKVIKVIDGDTYYCLDKNEKKYKIRLKGTDCPELNQKFGKKAKENVENLILNKWVEVVFDDKDIYNRKLAWIYLPNEGVLNEIVLINGWAWPYPLNNPKIDQKMIQLATKAKSAKLGLWADPNPIPPWEWRKKKKKN
jgi:endonuclease YncB( thermonuclease family)